MLYVAKGIFCFILAVMAIALSEVAWHKFLFHSRLSFVRYLTNLWDYDPKTHQEHHTICKKEMEDRQVPDEEYWVQMPSNVFAFGVIAYILEVLLLWLLGFQWYYFIINGVFTAAAFTFWYHFEDHFHLGMHKKTYYEKHIKNTWQAAWFKYAKRCHTIHHRCAQYNLGFVFFPIGDLLIGTYCHTYKQALKRLEKKSKKVNR